MKKWCGWAGKVLWIDLTKGKAIKKELERNLAERYLGGRGLNARRLFDLVGSNIDALSPENYLFVGAGPLVGTAIPSCSRTCIAAKSPVTDIIGYSSFGGHFAPELKYAGYDQIVIYGKAEKPVYIWIDDDIVEIKDAGNLMGKDTLDTQEIIKEEYGDMDAQVACIGPAGENVVRAACIIHETKRAAGRCGMGAVMGSKNLKAISVRGTKDIEISDIENFEEGLKQIREIKNPPWSEFGSPIMMDWFNPMGMMSAYNYTHQIFEGCENLYAKKLKEHSIRMKACFGCYVHCTHHYLVKDGKFAGTSSEGPEFGTISSLGQKCGNRNLASTLYMNELINKYGLDANSTGNIIAWAMDCYEREIFSKEDTDGLELKWGNYDVMIELIHKIAKREGKFGNILAEGEKRAPKMMGKGSERYAYTVKNLLSCPTQDPRTLKLFGFSFVTANRGMDHCTATAVAASPATIEALKEMFGEEIAKEAADRFSSKGCKGRVVPWFENFNAVIDSSGMCGFFFGGTRSIHTRDLLAKIISATTGMELDGGSLLEIGERIYNVERAFNAREGLARKDDNWSVPEKFSKEPVIEGDSKGQVIEIDEMLDDYYKARGWDVKTGLQTRKRLIELNLEDVADKLQKLGKIA